MDCRTRGLQPTPAPQGVRMTSLSSTPRIARRHLCRLLIIVTRCWLPGLSLCFQLSSRPSLFVLSGLAVAGEQTPFALCAEWELNALLQRHVLWVEVGGHADDDVALRHVQPQSAMQPVPQREAARPIGTCLVRNN